MSLIDQLPKVVLEGRREANRILEGLFDNTRLSLQTNELVIPSKDSNYQDLFDQLKRLGQPEKVNHTGRGLGTRYVKI